MFVILVSVVYLTVVHKNSATSFIKQQYVYYIIWVYRVPEYMY